MQSYTSYYFYAAVDDFELGGGMGQPGEAY
jgi:hypothetical protein